jgi:phosphohistidine phosphatase
MNLYFIRHAHAVERDEWTGPDMERPLIGKGRQAAEVVARGLARITPPVNCIVTSPYARALDTAQIIATVLHASIVQCEALSPRFDITHLMEALEAAGWASDTALVGHEPNMGMVLSLLTGHSLPETELKKAAVALVTAPEDRLRENKPIKQGTLRWIRPWREWETASGE